MKSSAAILEDAPGPASDLNHRQKRAADSSGSLGSILVSDIGSAWLDRREMKIVPLDCRNDSINIPKIGNDNLPCLDEPTTGVLALCARGVCKQARHTNQMLVLNVSDFVPTDGHGIPPRLP